MWATFIFLLCFIFFNENVFMATGMDEDGKMSSFKAKLAKDKFAETLKTAKSSSLEQLQDQRTSTEINLGITLPPPYENDTIKVDTHTYYNSTFYTNPKDGKHFWIDLDGFPEEHVITHEMLSDSHRQATTVELSFEFPFYGALIKNITIATGGFLYMGDYLHNWIAATQYVAPLMANFDTSLSRNSTIKYADNGTAIIIQWDKVHIQDRMNDGAFTFQVTLFKNGDIIFAYKEIPFSVTEISSEKHPVKIGISDAYILERSIFFVRRKTIYEYHRIDMLKKEISNNTAIYFTALTTCLDFKNCSSCLDSGKELACTWCEAVQRCSDGIDRMRQSWVVSGCAVKFETTCPAETGDATNKSSSAMKSKSTKTLENSSTAVSKAGESMNGTDVYYHHGIMYSNETNEISENLAPLIQDKVQEKSTQSISTGAIVTILIFITVLIAVSMWVFYAYRFPQTSSGQFLIKYRPTQWNFKPEGNSQTTNSLHI